MPSGLDDAAFDPSSEVDDDALGRIAVEHGSKRLAGLQDFDRALRQGRLIDVGGAVLKIIGDQEGIGVARISNGMRRLTLTSLYGVEEDTHG